jgi:hypothetical protein
MHWGIYFVDCELRRLEREHPSKDARFRQEWYEQHSGRRRLSPRAVAGRAGDLLVRAGEHLRSWSAPGATYRTS